MTRRGFILTPTYRVADGVPEVRLHAVLEDGTPALLIDDRAAPYFFVPAAAASRVPAGRVRPADGLRSFDGGAVVRVEVDVPGDVPPLRARFAEAGVPCFEADVRFAYRWMIDRDLRGAFEVEGEPTARTRHGLVFRNAAVRPADFTPALRVLSFDIETTLDASQLHSIACAGAGGEVVMVVRDHPVAGAEAFPNERMLVAAFLGHVAEVDPDVLTGWNVTDFDLPVLQRIARRHDLRLTLGRSDDDIEFLRDRGFGRESRVVLAGRVVLDGLALLRSSYLRLEDYRLETAARAILGRGKLFGPERRGERIEEAWAHDPAALVAYNLEDARLVLDILAATRLIDLTVRRSLTTGMQLDRVSAQIAAVDSLYLRALRRRGRVAPSVGAQASDGAGISGGLVLDSVPGLYRNILVFDFRSLYPSLIRTFNIDPLTHVATPPPDAALQATPSGAAFRRDERGVLPEIVDTLWDARAAAEAAGDTIGAQALKILMNSLFGVLGAPASRLFSPAVANAITTAGRHVIGLVADAMRARGFTVVYGDTDSVFVDAGAATSAEAAALGRRLTDEVGADVAARLAATYDCSSRLELEFEKVYERFFMPAVRGRTGGSKKRYAGLVGGTLEVVGLEAVRRDWSGVARRFQRELLGRIFRDEPLEDFIRDFVGRLESGDFDDALEYRRALRKPVGDYTATTPPHVKAARKRTRTDDRIVRYVMTTAGPEPSDERGAPPDYEHYVVHQLEPIADAILPFVGGADFATVTGRRAQLSLF